MSALSDAVKVLDARAAAFEAAGYRRAMARAKAKEVEAAKREDLADAAADELVDAERAHCVTELEFLRAYRVVGAYAVWEK